MLTPEEDANRLGRRQLLGAVAVGGAAAAALPKVASAAGPDASGSPRHGVFAPVPTGGDDSASLQRAIDRAGESGSELILAAGTYRLRSVLDVSKPVSIRGQGIHRTRLQWADGAGSMPGTNRPGAGSGLIFLKHVDGLYIRDLHVDCNSAGNPRADLNGIYGLGCRDVVVEGVRVGRVYANFNGEFGNGMRFVSSRETRCERIRVSRCRVTDVLMSHAIQFSLHPRHCIVTENEVSDCTHGIDMSTGFFNTVSNNLIYRCNSSPASVGLALTSASHMTVVGNVISECSVGILGRMGDMTITGNLIHGASRRYGIGIDLANGRNYPRTLGSNFIQNFETGIRLENTANVGINGNTLQDCEVGIRLSGDTVRATIVGNVLQGVTTPVAADESVSRTVLVANNVDTSLEPAYGQDGLTSENLSGS